MYVYLIDGIDEIMGEFCRKFGREKPEPYISRNIEFKEEEEYNPLPDFELFKKVAQEYRQTQQTFWG
jgi:hypothetical protein